MMSTLIRQTFKTSRLTEFCSQKELVNQTGHDIEDWPFVIIKELVDNALDGCEEVGIAPVVSITVNVDGITVADNGGGISAETVTGILDYVRVSSREAYVSPTRGAQGNALKTILAMPAALGNGDGTVTIESRGIAHTVNFVTDRIRQEPRIELTQAESSQKIGTKIAVAWPQSACRILADARHRIVPFVANFSSINPHASITLKYEAEVGGFERTFLATDAAWPTISKWKEPGSRMSKSRPAARTVALALFSSLRRKASAICSRASSSRIDMTSESCLQRASLLLPPGSSLTIFATSMTSHS
jgi:DNA topoisomerase VI subunit B